MAQSEPPEVDAGGMCFANACDSAFSRKKRSSLGRPGPVTDAPRPQMSENTQSGSAARCASFVSCSSRGAWPSASSRSYRFSNEDITLNAPVTRQLSTVVTVSFSCFRMKNRTPSKPGTRLVNIFVNSSLNGSNISGRVCRKLVRRGSTPMDVGSM